MCICVVQDITDEDYVHAQVVWEMFDCQTLGDYHDLYLQTGEFYENGTPNIPGRL